MRHGLIALSLMVADCTHASVSSVPMEVPGVGMVYRYQGRANFPHQIAEADRLMTEHCLQVNGGKPVQVDRRTVDLGTVRFDNAQAHTTGTTNIVGGPYSAVATSNSQTSVTGSGTALRNFNQEILYKCVTPKS
jgi:hypothetical protein